MRGSPWASSRPLNGRDVAALLAPDPEPPDVPFDQSLEVALPAPDSPNRGGWERYQLCDLHEQVGRAVEAAGLEVLDLRGPFQRYPPLRVRLDVADNHPSLFGQAEAARAILERLEADLCALHGVGGPSA